MERMAFVIDDAVTPPPGVDGLGRVADLIRERSAAVMDPELSLIHISTPVETRPLLDLEKLRASFESGPSQREPTVVVSPVRYAQSLLSSTMRPEPASWS